MLQRFRARTDTDDDRAGQEAEGDEPVFQGAKYYGPM
jgi:hypothetical protein